MNKKQQESPLKKKQKRMHDGEDDDDAEMDLDAMPKGGGGGAGGGSSGRRRNQYLPTPRYKHSYDITITKTTQLQLEPTGDSASYFIPHCIFDWWCTEPAHDTKLDYYTYNYIPAYKDLLFYEKPADRAARKNFWHFVQPLSGHIELTDFMFFSDDLKAGSTPTEATYGFESAYIMYGRNALPNDGSLTVEQPTGYMSNVLFAKTTLPQCKINRRELMDNPKMVAIHGGNGISIDVPFHDVLTGGARFVLPIANFYANANQGTFTNFTYLPFRNKYFKTGIPALKSDGNALEDNKYWLNFDGYSINGYGGPSTNWGWPADFLWFPSLGKADNTDYKIRASCFMTTHFKVRLYSKWPVHSDECYKGFEAYLGQHYKYNSYGKFTKYPVSGCI